MEFINSDFTAFDRKNICLCGDFNAVRNMEERRTRGVAIRSLDSEPFERFINDNILIDLPLHG
jgi:hypothetical protein